MKTITSIKIELLHDDSPDMSWLGSYSNEPKNAFSIRRENAGSRDFKWFNPVAENLAGETPENAAKIAQADFKRMESLGDDWHFVGIRAVAEIVSANHVCHSIKSGGLWGIESDADKSYLNEVALVEIEQLRAELRDFGFTVAEIDAATPSEFFVAKPTLL